MGWPFHPQARFEGPRQTVPAQPVRFLPHPTHSDTPPNQPGVDHIWMGPGSKVLYLGAASGTTVSHVADIVGACAA